MEVAGTLDGGGGVLTVAGVFAWNGGLIAPGSQVTLATNGVMIVGGYAGYNEMTGVITNNGSILVTNGSIAAIVYDVYGGGIGRLVNAPRRGLDLQADVDVDGYTDGSTPYTPALINEGTVRKSGGTITSAISALFYNPGTVDALSGTLSLAGGGGGNGRFLAGAGATLDFDFDYEVDSDLAGAGTVTLSAGNFMLNGQMTVSNLVFGGSTVLMGANVVADPFTWTGSARMGTNEVMTVATNGVLTIGGNAGFNDLSGVITNNGSILITNGVLRFIIYYLYGGGVAQLVNAPGGVIDLQADVDFDTYDDDSTTNLPVLINAGTLRKSGGVNTSAISLPFYNPGTVDAESGTREPGGRRWRERPVSGRGGRHTGL